MLKAKLLGATAGAEVVAIEDVFSTYLYRGTDAAVTITNGIDLAGEGGLVWVKARSEATSHCLQDTLRGTGFRLLSNTNDGNTSTTSHVTAFNNNGFTVGTSLSNGFSGGQTYASWTFRQAPRFFDVVTYTGNGGTARAIGHDLGVTPGMVIVKRTNAAQSWHCLHKDANLMFLDTTDAAFSAATTATRFGDGTNVIRPNSTTFTVTGSTINNSGDTYVAYLFAHDPLGPSGDGSDGLIACGSYTGNGSTTGPVIDLGWEPQWLIIKRADTSTQNWFMTDIMRGMPTGVVGDATILANTSGAESVSAIDNHVDVTATGFTLKSTSAGFNASANTYIYIAIRRGPMREPTVGTEVFGLSARTGTGANATVTGGQTADAVLVKNRGSAVADLISSRMTGTGYLITSTGNGEVAAGTTILQANPWDVMNGVKVGTTSTITNASSNTFINYFFRRAPGFFDVVAYTGTGSARTINHNLGAVPELLIVKSRGITANWAVYSASTGAAQRLELDSAAESAAAAANFWNLTTPTSVVFSVGSAQAVNQSGTTYIAYLFASLPGISKVGTYTGNGSNQTINCAFTTGARFVLIKRTDVAGDWYVWDTARGIVSGNDPHLSLNTTAAEVTSNDTIDPDNSGFIVNQVAATNVNVNAATYIYLAIA